MKTFQLRLVLSNLNGNFLTSNFPTKNFSTFRFFQLPFSTSCISHTRDVIWAWHCNLEIFLRQITVQCAIILAQQALQGIFRPNFLFGVSQCYLFQGKTWWCADICLNQSFWCGVTGSPYISFLQKYHDEIIFNHDHLRIRSSSDFDIFIFSTNI